MEKSSYQRLQESGKGDLSISEISAIIRKYLKENFPSCKFSVTTQYYSGGASIHLNLMETEFNIIKPFEDISETALIQKESNNYTREEIKKIQSKQYHQLNDFTLMKDYDPDNWNNGVFITEKAHNVLKKIIGFIESYNFNDSDIQTDYFSVNFYLHVNIGQYDKPYKFRSKTQ